MVEVIGFDGGLLAVLPRRIVTVPVRLARPQRRPIQHPPAYLPWT
ncbi:hypothetical protein PR370_02625 [Mycobacterium marinum]|nr:hypothetical protein [Mycobacterium marinum]MDC9008943.1 hypothetical protein [Mycobacterium marinum]